MLGIKLRAGLLGLMAMLMLGAFSAAPAFAEGGPFCHHRANSKEGEGELIKEAAPEQIKGKGGRQVLSGKVLGMAIVNEAANVEVKGNLYNNADQCQTKIELVYNERSVSAPFAGCTFKVNKNNLVKLFGHRAWKYNGNKAELEEKPKKLQRPDWIFLPNELQQGATQLPEGTYATIIYQTKPGEKCSINGVEAAVGGSVTAQTEPSELAVWSTKEVQIIPKGEGLQDFWNGTTFIETKTGLKFGEGAEYKGTIEVETAGRQGGAAQEVALFEK